MLRWIKLAISTIFLGICVFYFYKFREGFLALRDITVIEFLTLSCLVLGTLLILGGKLKAVTRVFGIDLQVREWFGLTTVSLAMNSLLFKTGSLAVSNYLKRIHGFPYMSFLGALAGDQLIMLSLSGTVGIIAASLLSLSQSREALWVVGGYAAFLIVVMVVITRAPGIKWGNHPWWQALLRAIDSLRKVLGNRSLLVTLVAYDLGFILLVALRLMAAGALLGTQLSLLQCFLYATVISLARSIPMVQSDLGLRELVVGLTSEIMGSGFQEGMMFTLVDRIFVLFWSLLFASYYKNVLLPKSDPEKPAAAE